MKNYSCILIAIALFIGCGTLYCQTADTEPHQAADGHGGGFCASDLLRGMQNPAMITRENHFNNVLYDLLRRGEKGLRNLQGAAEDVYTIPVVVHIIHDGGAENISDTRVIAGIQHMNDAFANVGVYDPSTGVSTGIQFCLAKRDPSGAFTTGITRTQSPMTDLLLESQDITLKNLVRWDPLQYLNIWVVREVTSESVGAGVAGYAYFPSSHGSPEDGIVGEAQWFGSSPGNSAMYVHEAGHYLGLYHTFEGGCANNNCMTDGDRVCDTPPDGTTAPIPCNGSFNSCSTDADDPSPNNPFRPVAAGGLGDQNDLFIDYMDYGRWDCYSVFTQGQKDRMRATLTAIRKSLLASKGCLSPCTNPVNASIAIVSNTVIAGTTVTFTNVSTGAQTYEWRVNGAMIATSFGASYTFNTQGPYIVTLTAYNGDPACTDIDTVIMEVTCPVDASFTANDLAILPGETVTFTNTSTGATGYEWFVDGVSIGTSHDIQHLFSTQGGYHVTLIASNGICQDTSASVFIRVGMCEPSKEWNIWYFGDKAGVDFNSGSPVGITDGEMFSHEGVASICDRDGKLLFYSDGLSIWNRLHRRMLDGTSLGGHVEFGSSQGVVIVPVPLSNSLYYVFTTSNWTDSKTELRYSVVDMSLAGGLGGVTSVSNVILNDKVAEQAAAVAHGNCRDIWIVSHERNNDRFIAYLLTPSGLVTTPVVSAVGSPSIGSNRFGYLKFSHDGKRISSTLGGNAQLATVTVFDFDAMSGQVSNPMVLADANEMEAVMSSEFSPDNRLLYASNFNKNIVFQYDLTAGDAAAVRASKLAVADAGRDMACFQLGPDGRIYIASWGEAVLSVIQYPNQRGTACGFVANGVDLKGRIGHIGLPGYIARYSQGSIDITGPQKVCISDPVQTFTVASKGCSGTPHVLSVVGDAEIIDSDNMTVRVRMKAVGDVMLIAEKANDCGPTVDTVNITVTEAPRIDLGADTALCSSATVTLDAGPGFDSYRWQDGSSGRFHQASQPGTYSVEVQLGTGCIGRDTIQVLPSEGNFSVDLGPDITMCEGLTRVLEADAVAIRYRWQDGSTDRTFTAFGPGRYWVEAIGPCGTVAADTIVIHPEASSTELGPDTTLCAGQVLQLDAGSAFAFYRWQDGSAGRTYTAQGPGTYWVEATLASGCFIRDTIQVALDSGSSWVDLGPDTVICDGGKVQLDAGPDATEYRWQDGSTGRVFTASGPGTYWVQGSGDCGIASDTIVVRLVPPSIHLGGDTVICRPINHLLDAGPGFTSYLWQDGSTGQTLRVQAPGTYTVRASVGECEVVSSIRIDAADDAVFTVFLADLPSVKVAPGTEITIPLRVDVSKGIITGALFRAIIRFNRTLLIPIGDMPSAVIRNGEGVIELTGTIGSSDTVALLTFMAALGNATQTSLLIDSFSVAGNCVEATSAAGGVIAVEICEEGDPRLFMATDEAALKVRSSQPAGGIITIDYTVIEDGHTTLYLTNALGERVNVLMDKISSVGSHVATLDTRELASGLYFVVMETPTQRLLEKVMVGR